MSCINYQNIWVNYNISLTWIKAIWGWFPLLTMIRVRENSEVVIIYPEICFPHVEVSVVMGIPIKNHPSHCPMATCKQPWWRLGIPQFQKPAYRSKSIWLSIYVSMYLCISVSMYLSISISIFIISIYRYFKYIWISNRIPPSSPRQHLVPQNRVRVCTVGEGPGPASGLASPVDDH